MNLLFLVSYVNQFWDDLGKIGLYQFTLLYMSSGNALLRRLVRIGVLDDGRDWPISVYLVAMLQVMPC